MLRRIPPAAAVVLALVVSSLTVLGLSIPAQAATPLGLEAGDLVISDPGHQQLVVHPADGGADRFISGVQDPQGLVVTRTGDIIVIDAGTSQIVKLAADGTQSVLANRGGINYLALDRTGTYVYYSGSGFGGVGRMRVDGSSRNDTYIYDTGDPVRDPNYAGIGVDSNGDVIGADWNGYVTRLHGSGHTFTQTPIDELSDVPPDTCFTPRPCNVAGLAVRPDDRVLVADTWNDWIWESDGTGGAVHYGTGLDNPDGVALGRDGTAYVADTFNSRVVAFSPDRSTQTTVVDDTELLHPTGVAVVPVPPAQAGDVFAVSSAGSVVRMAADGSDQVTLADGLGALTDVAVDDEGNAFVSSTSGSVFELPADGSTVVLSYDGGARLSGLAIGPDDSLYLAQQAGGIRRDTGGGAFGPVVDDGADLRGIAVDGGGGVHVATGSKVATVAADTLAALPPTFVDPQGVTWDPTGRLLVADPGADALLAIADDDPSTADPVATVADIDDVTVAGDGGLWATDGAHVLTLDPDGSDLATVASLAGATAVDTYAARPSFTDAGPVPDAANVGTAYDGYVFDADDNGGGTPRYRVYDGALPPGLGLDPVSGELGGTPTTAGTYDFRVLAVNKARGTVTDQQEIVVGKRLQAITGFASTGPSGKLPDDTYTPTAAGGASGKPVVFSIDPGSSSVCSISAGVVTFLTGGTCTILADQDGDTDYEPSPQLSQNVYVDKLNQTISYPAPTGPFRVGGTYTPSATGSGQSGLAVTYAITGSLIPPSFSTYPCEYDAGTGKVTFTHAGTCRVQATQPGNDRYWSASQTRSLTVAAGTLAFDAGAPDEVRVGDTYAPAASFGDDGYFDIDYGLTDYDSGASQYVCWVDFDGVSYTAHFDLPGTCVLTANPYESGDWTTAQATTTITILKTAQDIVFDAGPTSPVVGGSYMPSATGGGSGNAVTFSIPSGSASVCSISAGGVSFDHAGDCVVRADQDGDGTHEAGTATQTVTIGKASQTISYSTTAGSPVVGDTYDPAATSTSGGTVTFSVSTPATCSISAGTVTFLHAGDCTLQADQGGTADYLAAPTKDQTVTVGKASQTVSFTSTAPASPVVGDHYDPTADATSGDAVTLSIAPTSSGVCTLTGTRVSFDHAGDCTVRADQAGGTDYLAATREVQTITVGQAPQTISFTSTAPATAPVGTTYDVTATSSSGTTVTFAIAGSSSVCSIAGNRVTFVAPGDCVVRADAAATGDYLAAPQVSQTIGVGKLAQVVTFTSTPPLAALPGDTYAVAATATSGDPVVFSVASGSEDVCSVTGATVHLDHAGTCTVQADQAGSSVWTVATATQAVTVAKRATTLELAVRPSSLAAAVTTEGAAVPSGLVEFRDGDEVLGTAPLEVRNRQLVAVLGHTRPAGGSHELSARYVGDDDFLGSEDTVAWTDPTILAKVTSRKGPSHGWYRSPVTVTFTCTVGSAPLVGGCPALVTLTEDRDGWRPIVRTITAEDGGTATATVTRVRIDRTDPKVKVKRGKVRPHAGGKRALRCVARDAMSGVDRCVVKQQLRPRAHLVRWTATAWDRAGNRTVVRGSYRLR